MLFLKYLSLGVCGCFVALLTKIYLLDRLDERGSVEVLSLAILTFSAKNFIFRELNWWDTMILVNLSTCISWLSFSFGYALMLYSVMQPRTETLPAIQSDSAQEQSILDKGTPESTRTLVLACLFLSACLMVLAATSLLIRQIY